MSLLTLPELAVIRRMLRANLRHTEIARRLGMPVETVTLVGTSRKLCRRRLDLLTEDDLPDDYDAPPDYLAANLRRCPDCGGMVYQWPCLACRLRAAQAAGVVLPDEEEEEDGPVGRGSPDPVGRGSPDPAHAPTEGLPSGEETYGPQFGEVRRPAPNTVRRPAPNTVRRPAPNTGEVRRPAPNTACPTPSFPLSPSFPFTEPSHAHA